MKRIDVNTRICESARPRGSRFTATRLCPLIASRFLTICKQCGFLARARNESRESADGMRFARCRWSNMTSAAHTWMALTVNWSVGDYSFSRGGGWTVTSGKEGCGAFFFTQLAESIGSSLNSTRSHVHWSNGAFVQTSVAAVLRG